MLGNCSQGELLRIKRHNTIRSILANALRETGLEVYEEVHCLADGGGTRRIDIIAINSRKSEAEIIDPTIRFETHKDQPQEVNLEKRQIYEPTIPYFQQYYNINKISVVGLLFGSQGTITKSFVTWKIRKVIQDQNVYNIIKYSIAIFRNHVYGLSSI